MRLRSEKSLAIREEGQLVSAKISLAQLLFATKRKYPFRGTSVTALILVHGWLAPLSSKCRRRSPRERSQTGNRGFLFWRLGDQLEVVRLVGDRPIAVFAHDGPLAQIEDAGHLVRIFLNHADAVLAHCA